MAQPAVKKIHKFEVVSAFPTPPAFISVGGYSSTHALPETIDPDKTWALVHARGAPLQGTHESMYVFELTADEITFIRAGLTSQQITFSVQLIEFSQGVTVQRPTPQFLGEFDAGHCGTNEAQRKCTYSNLASITTSFPISVVNKRRAFVTIKTAHGQQANCNDHKTTCGWNPTIEGRVDIVQEMFARAKFNAAGDEVLVEHNVDTIGQNGTPVMAAVQVVEFDQGARVWYGEIDNQIGLFAHDIVQELIDQGDRPPDLRKTFLLFSRRCSEETSGAGARGDEWTMDGALFNGTGGVFRCGPNAGSGEEMEPGFFVVELDFIYVESYFLQGAGTGGGAQVVDQELGAIRDADNSVALLPWCQWSGVSHSAALNEFGEVWSTVELVDETTLRMKRERSNDKIEAEVYVIEFQEPPDIGLEPVEFKALYTGEELNVINDRDVALPATVDPSRAITWCTAEGGPGYPHVYAWSDFVDGDTLRIHAPGSPNYRHVNWHIIEFESGISVQRGTFDFQASKRPVATINEVDPNRSIVIQQWGGTPEKGIAFLSGGRQVRGLSNQSSAPATPPCAWQVVQLPEGSEVLHYGLAWRQVFAERTLPLDSSWVENEMLWWSLGYPYSGGTPDNKHPQNVHIADPPLDLPSGEMTVYRGNTKAGLNTVHEFASLGPLGGHVPVHEAHFVQIDDMDGPEIDVPLDHEFDPARTVAWVGYGGHHFTGNPANFKVLNVSASGRLFLSDTKTLRISRNDNNHAAGEVYEGTVHVLGFEPAPEGFVPEGPEGFYFGDLGGDTIHKFGSTNQDL